MNILAHHFQAAEARCVRGVGASVAAIVGGHYQNCTIEGLTGEVKTDRQALSQAAITPALTHQQ